MMLQVMNEETEAFGGHVHKAAQTRVPQLGKHNNTEAVAMDSPAAAAHAPAMKKDAAAEVTWAAGASVVDTSLVRPKTS